MTELIGAISRLRGWRRAGEIMQITEEASFSLIGKSTLHLMKSTGDKIQRMPLKKKYNALEKTVCNGRSMECQITSRMKSWEKTLK